MREAGHHNSRHDWVCPVLGTQKAAQAGKVLSSVLRLRQRTSRHSASGKQVSLSQTVTQVELHESPGRPHSPSRGSLQLPGSLCCWCFCGVRGFLSGASWHDQRQRALVTSAQTSRRLASHYWDHDAGESHAVPMGTNPWRDEMRGGTGALSYLSVWRGSSAHGYSSADGSCELWAAKYAESGMSTQSW